MQAQSSLLNKEKLQQLTEVAIILLKKLIAIPSFSKEEQGTADLIQEFLESKGIKTYRKTNNVWAFNKFFQKEKPTILLNSHHDTVKPNSDYTRSPFTADIQDGKLFGLGSNDAGGALVSLLATFLYFYDELSQKYNLIFAATAEEEISGKNGIESILPEFKNIEFAIVGEPTQMNLSIAEKGLMVLDCAAHGKAAHAAHGTGENAIYNAMKDIEWFRTFQFPKVSEILGKITMNVTLINSGTQHNIVPDKCQFTVDIRTTDVYSNEEVLQIIKQNVQCKVVPRSLRLKSSAIDKQHSIVQTGISLGRKIYGSSTLSDCSLMNFPACKIGPGDSFRSHIADEFIYLNEIGEGIQLYVKMLEQII